MKYMFIFDFRLMCEEYFDPALAGKDPGKALEFAKSALEPSYDPNVLYERDIAPRITLDVIFMGFDRLDRGPDQCAQWMARVSSDDLRLLWSIRQNAADEWADGEASEYPILQIVEGFGS